MVFTTKPYLDSSYTVNDSVPSLMETLDQFGDVFGTIFTQSNVNFPPYNIIYQDENKYSIELAVAGFSKQEITIEFVDGVLTVSGKKVKSDVKVKYQHHGIALRNFVRTFNLATNIVVEDAVHEDGLLKVNLKKIVPELKKSTLIAIK
jgi:molecular chaperone IbpA